MTACIIHKDSTQTKDTERPERKVSRRAEQKRIELRTNDDEWRGGGLGGNVLGRGGVGGDGRFRGGGVGEEGVLWGVASVGSR